MTKNRYTNVLPPDQSRVVLENGSYINANLVSIGDGYAPMIACQAPLSSTIEDFLLMILQYKSPAILMVTPLIEGEVIKSTKYWPNEGKTIYHGSFKVSNMRSNKISPNLTVSYLRISLGEEFLLVHHIHYTGMPDGRGSDLDELLLVICLLLSVLTDLRPFVCHCSAGIGRTGVIATILRCLRTGEPPITAIRNIRYQRHGMVQTKTQFRLIRNFIGML